MKIKTLLYSAATVTALCAFTAPLAEKDIIGQWKIADTSVESYTKHVMARAGAISPEVADQMEAHKSEITTIVKSIRLTFKANSDYENASLQGTKSGKWKLTNGAHTLEVIKPDGTTRKDSVLELSATRLKIINRELKDTSLFVRP